MKKLITADLGGHPVYFKDFEFIQEQIRELALANFGGFDDTIITVLNSVVFDIATDGFTIEVTTAGWAYYNGEMFYVPLQSATGSAPNILKWTVNEANDPRGLKTFKEESVGDKNVYLVRTLLLGYYPAVAPGIDFDDTGIPPALTDWTEVIYQGAWRIPTSPPADSDIALKYRINGLGQLEIIGTVEANDDPQGTMPATDIIGILEEWAFPAKERWFQITLNYNDKKSFACSLAPNGELRFHSRATDSTYYQANQDLNFCNILILDSIA